MIDPGNGIHPAISFPEYLRIPRVNNSDLKHMGVSPAHYDHNQTNRTASDKDVFVRGRAVSMAIFEPERFRSTYDVFEGRRAGKVWEAFEDKANRAGVEVLKAEMHDIVKAIAKSARSSEMARPFISGGRGEVSMCWTHVSPDIGGLPGYSIDCKGRPDFIPRVGSLADVKVTKNASPDQFSKQSWNLGYHVQAAWYLDGYEALTGERRQFRLIAVEAAAPHVVQVYRVPDDLIELGRETYRERLDRLAMCRRESRWPGYAESEIDLPIPAWATPSDADTDLSDLGLTFHGEAA